MPLKIKVQLVNSKGLQEIVVFDGLAHNLILRPYVYGEPLLTVQAFYYLEQMESVGEVLLDAGREPQTQEIEYLVDNYLFEYSKINDKSKVCAKTFRGRFWLEDAAGASAFYDQRQTEALVLDSLNDDSVLSVHSADESDDTCFPDWCLIRNYTDQIFEEYLESLSKVIDKKVVVRALPTPNRDGVMGRVPLLNRAPGLLDYFQSQEISDISQVEAEQDVVQLTPNKWAETIESIPVRRVALRKRFSPVLLSYYFSGLREYNPLFEFLGFYNVLEFYFEEAPRLLGKRASREREQLKCVIQLLVSNETIFEFIEGLPQVLKSKIAQPVKTSSGVDIPGFKPENKSGYLNGLVKWVYSIRCAIVHSKKSYGGSPAAVFEPYSMEAENIGIAVPIVKWLAIECIEKDSTLEEY